MAGCPFRYAESLGGHIPEHDETIRTPLPGLYVAGNITGIESAKVAMAQGTLAGLAISADAGALPGGEDAIAEAARRVRRTRREAIIQFHPGIGTK